LDEVANMAFHLIQLMQLGKMESGSISTSSKYMSREQRWFRAKEGENINGGNRTTANNDIAAEDADVCAVPQQIFLSRNSLVQLQCKRGHGKNPIITHEYYRVLGFFNTHYNKWYMPVEDKFVFAPNEPAKMKNIRVMGQLLHKRGSSYTEVKLTKNGEWGPTHVYCIKPLNDVLPMGAQGAVILDLFTY
jgi:hypothetical protein